MPRFLLVYISFFCILSLSGCMTLFRAASDGDISALESLTAKGANPDAADPGGMTALMLAARSDKPDAVRWLIARHANIHLKDPEGRTALEVAHDSNSLSAFRVLLENGASAERLVSGKIPAKAPFLRLIREYALYREIMSLDGNPPPEIFDAWFSQFPDGQYRATVEPLFRQMIAEEFRRCTTPECLKKFIRTWSKMGKNLYQVSVPTLNIRAENSTRSRITGKYEKDEIVHVRETQANWLRTGQGWIHRDYVKPVPVSVALAAHYVRQAGEHLVHPDAPVEPPPAMPGLPEAKAEAPAAGLSPDESPEKIRGRLKRILKAPTLPELETFILSYKGRKDCAEMVQKARESYKKLILGN